MNRKLVFAALIAILLTSVAMAGDTGYYLGGGVSQAYQKVRDSSVDIKLSGNATGWKVFGGYNFIKFFGVEASYVDFGSVKDQSSGIHVKTQATAWDAFAVGKIPIGFVEPFAKIGYAYLDSKASATGLGSASDTSWDLAYGVGVGFNFAKHMHVRAEYEWFDISPKYSGYKPKVDLYQVSASFAWRF